MICYHHNDLDGRCAAAIVLRKYPECRTREIDYKDDPCFKDEILKGTAGQKSELVFIVDFSFKPEKMKELLSVVDIDDIRWIDHHKTAKEYNYDFIGLRDFSEPGKSGCELTWEYLFPEEKIPEVVRLIGDYDTWRFDTEHKSKMFHLGLSIENTKPSNDKLPSFPWALLFEKSGAIEDAIGNYIYKGSIISEYRNNWCHDYRQFFGYEVDFEGTKCFVMNVYTLGSLGFGTELESHDICIACVFSGEKWTVGLYSTKIDVSVIAKKYGGGGHKGAAGFVCEKLPF
jgi:oligoribonuclease NrnB/cAMP/cGMP phosphodiesterase (DHH superfamily)